MQFAERCSTVERIIQKGEVNLQKLFYELRNHSKEFHPVKIDETSFFPSTPTDSCMTESSWISKYLVLEKNSLSEDLNTIPPLSSGLCRSVC